MKCYRLWGWTALRVLYVLLAGHMVLHPAAVWGDDLKPPAAHDQSEDLYAGQKVDLKLSYAYYGAEPLTFYLTEPPGHGSLEYNSGSEYLPVPILTGIDSISWRYEPDPAFVGMDTFNWTVSDGLGESEPATFTLDVKPNTAPVAYGLRLVGPPDTAMTKAAQFYDPDGGQTRTAHIVTEPENGSVSILGQSTFVYTPDEGFTGEDSFTYTIYDGVDHSNEALVRIQVRTSADRAGNLILIIVRDTLYPNLADEVDRLQADLIAEGYTAEIHTRPNDSNANLWAHIKSVYDDTDHWLEGVLLIGDLPRPQVNAHHSYHGARRDMYTDLPLWNMKFYQTEDAVNINDLRIWVGRFYAVDSNFGDEITLLRRALDANHAARTGKARLPHDAYFYHAWENMAPIWSNLEAVWPNVEVAHEVNPQSDHKSEAQFLPWRTEFAGKGGSDALIAGGDVFQETSHGRAQCYMNNTFWTEDLFHYISQQRACMIGSCTTGAYNGIANHHILTRGGGTVFAVSGSDINWASEFQTAGTSSAHVAMRARLAEGEAWGSALWRHYAFGARDRIIFYGDLSLPVMASPPNAVPVVEELTTSPSGEILPGQPVVFSMVVSDPNADTENSPYVDFNHQVEWFMDGYNAGRNEPDYTKDDAQHADWTQVTHVYPMAGAYTVRAEVMDEWQARGWKELTVIVRYPMEISSFSPVTPTFMNAGETLTFSIEATDPGGGGELTYAWDVDGEPLAGDEPHLTWTAPGGISRVHILRATAFDAWGSSISHEWAIDVTGVPVPVGPVGYWRLDEESGVRFDSSGYGNHLNDHNHVGFAEGVVGNAALFDGERRILAIPNADQTHLNLREALTAVAWVRPTSASDNRMIMTKWDYGEEQSSWRFYMWNRMVRFCASPTGDYRDTEAVRSNITLSANQWQHVAVVYDAGYVRFYLNGVLDPINLVHGNDMSVTSLFDADIPFAIGAEYYLGRAAGRFDGRIDDARLFRRVLSGAEIAALYAGANQPPIAVNDSAVTPVNQAVWIDVLDNDGDPDGDALTLASAGPATHGTVALTDAPAGVLYTPDADFMGQDVFSYTIEDAHAATSTATVRVLVVGDMPIELTPTEAGSAFGLQTFAHWKYRVEYKDDLSSDEEWKELFRHVSDVDELIDIPFDESYDKRFYRIQVRP